MNGGHKGSARAGQRATTNREYEGGQSVIQNPVGKQGKENPLELRHI